MYLRYSSRVVAPMQCNSPRANIGLRRFPASIAPSVLPAPTMVCNSSMNKIILPSLFLTSLRTAFKRSSNSPRNFAPATSAPRSSEYNLRSRSPCGTSPCAIRCAKPSAIAVLPTPASPISTGLFLVLRESICMQLRISSSRPITGSSFCLRASSTRSVAYLLRESNVASGLSLVTRTLPRAFAMDFIKLSLVAPYWLSKLATDLPLSKIANITCSTDTYSSFMSSAIFSASLSTALASLDKYTCPPPDCLGKRSIWRDTSASNAAVSTWVLASTETTKPSSSDSKPYNKCNVDNSMLPFCCAMLCALCTASNVFCVYLLVFILSPPFCVIVKICKKCD